MATKEKAQQYVVIARSTETIKEKVAMAGKRAIPFETPVFLSGQELQSLRRQKEPIQVEKQVSVMEIMEKHRVSQAKANEMARLISENPDQGGKKITFVSKYIVSPV